MSVIIIRLCGFFGRFLLSHSKQHNWTTTHKVASNQNYTTFPTPLRVSQAPGGAVQTPVLTTAGWEGNGKPPSATLANELFQQQRHSETEYANQKSENEDTPVFYMKSQ